MSTPFDAPDPIFGAPDPIFGQPSTPPPPPAPEPQHIAFDPAPSAAERRAAAGKEVKPHRKLSDRIPRLPEMPRMDPAKLAQPEQRQVACVNMKLAGASFHEIATELNYANADAARTAYYSALANMHPPEDIETLRQAEGLRAEALFRASLAKATASHFVATEVDEETGEEYEVKIANTEQLKWHEQAAKDLALHAAITGAKAPARMEVNASTEEINRIVHLIVQNQDGEVPREASIWQMDEIEAIDAEIVEED
ncbi:ribbon-helix-helix DNA binding domain protein [Microbacterium phage Squash]|uniref:Ribbon-helix-helix DNA binding domain protein n=1 Tax=Microbacterium phage Squash TaxID=2182357 RepID=A0A2U8ULQ5_9CAUD|nr:ribbon-helix-helix DNA binding domain protein [Microbacterium phage Squash]AWN04637.1 ribbon-helix-helix DNA binding domain protein [Microbacterium phage Squash]QIQ63601.1 hypothetical protein SEA_NIKE_17 [Microbacterium phage Nike]